MFELQYSGENRRKRSEFFFENLPREYKDLILVKKKFKIISCLCTFKEGRWVAKLEAQPACYGSSLGSNPDISQKYKMGVKSNGVANTL
jgi:hypothetical protein